MTKKQRLELTWIGKEIRPKLEPRILLEDPDKSYHAAHRMSENDIFDNRLIFGDNLLALKALESEFAGKIKCVFIDPPYNTGSAFEHYDDGVEHSIWLGLMRDRLEIIRRLLSEDGSLWITIDDNEAHYLKVMCDEIFGRVNFVANCLWQKVYSERMDARGFSVSHDHVIVYQKSNDFAPIQLSKEQNSSQFKFFDKITGKYYRRRSLRKEGSESRREDRPSMWYSIKAPDGTDIYPVKPDGIEGRWRWKKENLITNSELIEYVKKDNCWEIYVKQFLEANASRPPATFWSNEEVGHNHEAKLEVRAFNSVSVFDTPKPERLIKRVLDIATKPNDLVLDSFAGSGTTGAVAHKMGRRWIMIELGEHCHTHIIPRLKKVIDGEDQGGISKAFNWKGGGGFRYYHLAPSLLEKDKWDNWIINKTYNAEMLAEALCKIEGFTYSPSDTFYWQQGYSTERNFIYVTTQNLRLEQLSQLADEVGQERSLLVLCTAFRGKTDIFPNLTVKKIPKQILSRCEWGHDDYSLKIENLPKAPQKIGQLTLFDLDNIQ
ncbi:site-specific DNA-methyltransferase [Planktothrix agardhii]|jgi:adenine-specific DNA-methyltransferase|uniref:Type III restriction-modification system HindVIP enzyme mod n=1 Tax=Planktothrix agardhii TaxID=1160 RepID=A0A1J1JGJ3_PLAAG|nr:site-specific DNA-methyltransferase [Planktothrix agardhii]MCF3606232.1 site-specific DNA-methyltransferase [Planktothrix agardhii 1033]BBD56110.1 DNA methylase N-4/N-6 domain protein [Planktothrix agardhii NIES-204]MBG0748056.1 site-specific DNA-methyltransferase [Planktothrix agardhii KL2]MCB8750344.1 site-specific DNA-methyltransferase [Planktothrix agardhii 1810]MCB8765144.1 site-specific DNA-methyltransferase [Planktothrix agardhii 1809]